MTGLSHFFVFIFLIINWLSVINAQEPDADQGELTPLPHAEVIVRLLNFKDESVEDCSLPCFAGIRPDKTTLSEIQELSVGLFDGDEAVLVQFDRPFEREDGMLDYILRLNHLNIAGSFSFSFIVSSEQEVLQRFQMRLNRPENWLESRGLGISEVLAVLGEPDELYISISAAQPSYFDIALGYETKGTLFRYKYFFEPEQLTQSEEPIPLCGSWSKTFSIDVWIQSVDEDTYVDLLEEKLRLGETANTEEIVYRAFWPMERMTNWNIEDWTQLMVENSEWCFDALSYDELLAAGYSY